MLKFEGYAQVEDKRTEDFGEKWFTVKAVSEAKAKSKIRKRYLKRKNLKVHNVVLEYVEVV
jgi:hypothetical protein